MTIVYIGKIAAIVHIIIYLFIIRMSYCSIQEAWGQCIPAEKRKKKMLKSPDYSYDDSERRNGGHSSGNVSRHFSRDIKTQRDFNGPEERQTVEPIELDEGFVSQHDTLDNALSPAGFEKQFLQSDKTSNDNISVSELEWIKEQLKVISEKIAVLSTNCGGAGLSGENYVLEQKKHGWSPTADLMLYLSTGILTIFFVDVLLKKRS